MGSTASTAQPGRDSEPLDVPPPPASCEPPAVEASTAKGACPSERGAALGALAGALSLSRAPRFELWWLAEGRIDVVAGHAGCIYGRRIYEVMRYWDVDRPEWEAPQHEFAVAWRRQPKWVASRTLSSVGPNATLIRGDVEALVDVEPPMRGMSREIIRIHPVRIRSWGLASD